MQSIAFTLLILLHFLCPLSTDIFMIFYARKNLPSIALEYSIVKDSNADLTVPKKTRNQYVIDLV